MASSAMEVCEEDFGNYDGDGFGTNWWDSSRLYEAARSDPGLLPSGMTAVAQPAPATQARADAKRRQWAEQAAAAVALGKKPRLMGPAWMG
mmetsp:Transcript_64187/g.165236  ORF Transcript_64187/g.165236 Transcript_64187/m.165236 type:complete len:91 (-) Transcript_64187:163-435(-)